MSKQARRAPDPSLGEWPGQPPKQLPAGMSRGTDSVCSGHSGEPHKELQGSWSVGPGLDGQEKPEHRQFWDTSPSVETPVLCPLPAKIPGGEARIIPVTSPASTLPCCPCSAHPTTPLYYQRDHSWPVHREFPHGGPVTTHQEEPGGSHTDPPPHDSRPVPTRPCSPCHKAPHPWVP